MPYSYPPSSLSTTDLYQQGSARAPAVSMMPLYGALAAGFLVSALLMARAELRLDVWSSGMLPYYGAALAAVLFKAAASRSPSRHLRALSDCAEYYALFACMALLGAVTSYPIAAMTHGYADPTLQRIDLALHFDWVALYGFYANHRALQLLGVGAYESIYLTPVILLGWFAWHGRRDEAMLLMTAFWLTAVLTLALFALMPAIGPFSFLWHQPIRYMPVSELWQPSLIPALRAHAVHVVDPGQLRGIVSAPSFHAAAGMLYIVTAWRTPALRWPLIWLNIAMLCATPVEGTHYLADILLGILVAIAALAAVYRTIGRRI